MQLPFDLLQNTYTRPDLYLCNINKEIICKLNPIEMSGNFKFNSYSELQCEISNKYLNALTGYMTDNPYYERIETVMLLYLSGFGYFEIQNYDLKSDGIKETKSITAYSEEYRLSQKYLNGIKINTGDIDSLEVINSVDNNIVPISLYNQNNRNLSLLDIVLENAGNWSIGHVDDSLKTLTRSFEIDRTSIYDFLMNDICEKFNCYILFDTIKNTVNVYAESKLAKFTADGKNNIFIINPPFKTIETVSVNGYKVTNWSYSAETGELKFNNIPEKNSYIEVIDGAQEQWQTDIRISFENLANEMDITYNSDDIKTVLKVTYGDNIDIREANLGRPYLMDLSYFHTVEWMGQDLYDAYSKYIEKINSLTPIYTKNSNKMLEYAGYIDFETNRLSLGYSIVDSVNPETRGEYYIRGGQAPNYYYTKVSLPADYNANTTYYSIRTTNLNETKVSDLYSMIKSYYNKEETWVDDLPNIRDQFKYLSNDLEVLITALNNNNPGTATDTAIMDFLNIMWKDLGKIPLEAIYYKKYKEVQITNIEAGWSDPKNDNYPLYYPVVLFLDSIEISIKERNLKIKEYQNQYDILKNKNMEIVKDIDFQNNFTKDQLNMLNPLLREDEINFDDIIETDQDSIEDTFKNKENAIASGKIELNKISQPKLQFKMTMANIYALKEFEKIINQFQLGNIIKISLRENYIKNTRLLSVNFNFNDPSDFSCEFGELTSIKTQSEIHADLLSQAITAGKSVATNSGKWTQGTDVANKTQQRIEQGLLDASTSIKSIDGTQGVEIDNYGIKLQKIDENGEINPEQIWMVNNKIVFTDDNFKTCRSAIGKVVVDGKTYYGLITELVLSGYIEGSKIKGGSIQIGNNKDGTYVFEVTEDGKVTINSGSIDGYATSGEMTKIEQKVNGIETTVSKITSNQNEYEERFSKIEENSEAIKITIGKIENDGANKVKTTENNYRFDDSGMHIQKSDTDIANKIDNTGMYVYRGKDENQETMLRANGDGVNARDLKAENYLIIGDNSRFEDYVNDNGEKRTACFFIG